MDRLNEQSRQQGNLIRFGTIAEVDLAAALCRVQSGEVVSDFVPWLVPCAGDTIEWSAPTVGEQVTLLCPDGDTGGAVVLRGLYSTIYRAPAAQAEIHLRRYADGAVVQYDAAAHALKAQLPAGGSAEIFADAGVTIHGPLTVNGNVQVNGDAGVSGTATADVDVIGGGKSLKSHRHGGVQAGGATSGPPQ